MAKKSKRTNKPRSVKKTYQSPPRVVRREATSFTSRPARLHALEDNRLFSPMPRVYRPQVMVTGHTAPIKSIPRLDRWGASVIHSVDKRSILCARRSIRKQILHAFGKAGAGNRKPKHNSTSNIKCK